MVKIVGVDDTLMEILDSRNRLRLSVPTSKDDIPPRSTVEDSISKNEQLVHITVGRVLVPGRKLYRWIRCNRVNNAPQLI